MINLNSADVSYQDENINYNVYTHYGWNLDINNYVHIERYSENSEYYYVNYL